MSPDAPRWAVAPYFIVSDVVASAAFYRDKLGFHYERLWNDPPSFCIVWRNGVAVMLAELGRSGAIRPNRTFDPEGGAWDAYVWIDDADTLFEEFRSKGVTIVREPFDQPYDCRDFEIDDCNGYRLCFGQPIPPKR